MLEDPVDYAKRLAADAAVWQRIATEGPAAADAEWQRLLAAVRRVQQQLEAHTFAIDLGEGDAWVWRAGDGALYSSEALANLAFVNLLARERAHRGIPQRRS